VHCRTSKTVPPNSLAAVKIRPGVASDIFAAEPQIHVELVGVGGTSSEVRAADDRFAVCAMEKVHAAMRKGSFGLLLRKRGSRQSAAQPKYVLIPRTRFKERLLFRHIGAELQKRAVIGEIAIVQR
jgi:hypothetical protein